MINRDLLIYYAGKAFPSLANVLIIVLGIRWLGEAGYGAFNLIFNAALVIASFCMGWLQQSALRYVPGQPDGGKSLSSQYAGFGQWSALFALFMTGGFCLLYFKLSLLDALTAGLFAAVWTLLSVHLTLLQSRFAAMSFALTESAYNLLIVTILATMLTIGLSASPRIFFLIFCISASITLLVAAFRQRWSIQSMSIHPQTLKHAFQFGFPLTIWLLISNLFNIADRYMISYYLGDAQTGMYASVYDLIYKLAALGCFPILLSRHPSIAAAWNNNAIANVTRIIRQSLLLEVGVLIGMLLGGIFLGKWLIQYFLKIDVPDFYMLSIPLILSSVLWQMALLIHKPMEMTLKTFRMIVYIFFSLALNCLLNVIFIPRFGPVAASFTTLISTLVYICLTAFTSYKLLQKSR
jgi:O-antigen/teichoic acid export membrane protein